MFGFLQNVHVMFRLTVAMCTLLKDLEKDVGAFRTVISEVTDVLIQFLIQPGVFTLYVIS